MQDGEYISQIKFVLKSFLKYVIFNYYIQHQLWNF